ncbi:hypothetical protein [Tenuibacillus multivorans]|uniref:X-X-X-Leu-X-X-Gly heptad repeat-containing protein n=1 Tax=Tenuibacillus multivorans TaxID=237069 RepID=A0A1G9YK52_9BACI|nr:hypothetical protein [Tenuibacillus multivorans]GEL78447.1 hypothetical protein TMU01_26820 [Tenuibacillus multivorans]SDN09504.1 X-X-X-Leu-X-X-Gly heptad repeat-containing protein [Tenuibacillus multivorans]
MRLRRITSIFLVCLLVIPTFLVSATTGSSSEDQQPQGDGSYTEKNEVVYATLDANGEQEDMYIVNNFNIKEPGKIVDYGPYDSVKNLTDLNDIALNDQQVEFTATEDEFYYQGNLEGQPLPWDINVSYQLNGETLPPEELLGEDGKLEIHIGTKANQDADSIFFENYLLQISVPLNADIYQNIEAKDGIVANAGKNKQVTFTVMPEKEEDFVIKVDVSDFEMESIEISAMPSSMSIDTVNADGMTSDMKSLSDATAEINDGVRELKQGISELNDGAQQLQDGSSEYKTGINELDQGSSELIDGSESIKAALENMSQSVSPNSSDMNMGNLTELQEGLTQIADGLKETENGLTDLKDQYGKAYSALDQSISAIPGHEISEKDIQALYDSDANSQVIDQLVETYQAAQTTKETYSNVKEAFKAVEPTLEGVISSLQDMRTNLETMADELDQSLDNTNMDESMKQLQEGLQTLSNQYQDFHSGLVDYTDGVSELSSSYDELHGGVTELSDGTDELENGASELHDGTTKLAESTDELPDQMQSEIDQMVSEYDKSDFKPVSFVSSKNEKVNAVQFVIKTESIKQDEDEEEAEEQKEEEKGFWEKLLDLFR